MTAADRTVDTSLCIVMPSSDYTLKPVQDSLLASVLEGYSSLCYTYGSSFQRSCLGTKFQGLYGQFEEYPWPLFDTKSTRVATARSRNISSLIRPPGLAFFDGESLRHLQISPVFDLGWYAEESTLAV